MNYCISCSSELKLSNTPFGGGYLKDKNRICTRCFKKLNNKNPKAAFDLKSQNWEDINVYLPDEKQIHPGSGFKRVTAIFAVFILLGFIYLIYWVISPAELTPQQVKEKYISEGKLTAIGIAEDFVKQNLKSPSSAEFPYERRTISYIGDSTFTINGYVDSQNSFGAMLRAKYRVVVKNISGDQWRLINIDLK